MTTSEIGPRVDVITEGFTAEKIEQFWQEYDAAFSAISDRNPCRQYYHKPEFVSAMVDPTFVKIVGYREDRLAFFAMGTEDLDKIPWISRAFYDREFSRFINSRFYVPVVYIPLNQQGIGDSGILFRAIQSYMRSKKLRLVLYDHGGAPPNSALTRIILDVPGTKRIGEGPIGTQLYQAVETILTEE